MCLLDFYHSMKRTAMTNDGPSQFSNHNLRTITLIKVWLLYIIETEKSLGIFWYIILYDLLNKNKELTT